jgi:hypothetical protein
MRWKDQEENNLKAGEKRRPRNGRTGKIQIGRKGLAVRWTFQSMMMMKCIAYYTLSRCKGMI